MQKNYVKITTRDPLYYPVLKKYAQDMSNDKKAFKTIYKNIIKYFQVDITNLLEPYENSVEFFTTNITPEMIIEDLKNIEPQVSCEILVEYSNDSMIEITVKNGEIINIFDELS